MSAAIKITGITADDLADNNSSYEPVPAGSYNGVIFEAKLEYVKSGPNEGKPRFNVQFKLTDEGVNNRRVFSYVPLYKANDFWKTKAFFSAIGIDMEAGDFTVPSPTSLAGKPIGVRVKIGTDMEGKPRNEVGGFDKSTDTAAAALAATGAKPVGDVW
jgi:hypothetical protein